MYFHFGRNELRCHETTIIYTFGQSFFNKRLSITQFAWELTINCIIIQSSVPFGVEKTNTFMRSRWKQYPISDQNGPKTTSFGAAHTYIAYMEYLHPPGGALFGRMPKTNIEQFIFICDPLSEFECKVLFLVRDPWAIFPSSQAVNVYQEKDRIGLAQTRWRPYMSFKIIT